MGTISLYLSSDNKYLVVDSNEIDCPVYIYDMKSLHLLHKCGSRLSTQKRVFLSGNFLCRQRSIIDIQTGKEVKSLQDFVPSKNYLACAISPDGKFIIIGNNTSTKIFNFASGNHLADISGHGIPSVVMISEDSKKAFIGFAVDCILCVVNLSQEEGSKVKCGENFVNI